MKITRIEKDGEGEWQVVLSDNEACEIIESLLMASLAQPRLPTLQLFANLTAAALCGPIREEEGIAKAFAEQRSKTIPRFILDATAIIKEVDA